MLAPSPFKTKLEESIAKYQKLLGPEVDMSEEVGMAREVAANASRDKGIGALVATGAGMLSAETPYMGQALGAGLMSGLSAYQQGAKEEQAANKDLMALQMAQKKSDLAGHRTAAEMYIGAQTKAAEKEAESQGRMRELLLANRGNLSVEQLKNTGAMQREQLRASQEQVIQSMKNMSALEIKEYEAGALSMDKIADIVGRSAQGGNSPEDTQTIVQEFMTMMQKNKIGGSSNPFNSLGNGFGVTKK